MAGTVVVQKNGYRISTLKGTLSKDIPIGYGILGRLHKGGTFDVERTQLAPGVWQVTDTHVHIEGRALFFKSIGQQDDEVKTHFTAVPLSTTLEQALPMLVEGRQP
jgi:predicted metalloprotease with PDZ domain